jgi:hydrogenase expression/formation protein HypD
VYSPIPTKLVDIQGGQGVIDIGEGKYPVNLYFTDSVRPGDYVLIQMGFAVRAIHKHEIIDVKPLTVIELRSKIESLLSGEVFTVLLTSVRQIKNLHQNNTRYILPDNLRFVYGPGCSMCLTPVAQIRNLFHLVKQKSVLLVTFSDFLQIPTPDGALNALRQGGHDIRIVRSPYDVLRIAEWNPTKEVVFAAAGYDTTAAITGVTLKEAKARGLKNISFYLSLHRRDTHISEVIRRVKKHIDGVVLSAYDIFVSGTDIYNHILIDLHRACCCTGFSAEDVLTGVVNLIRKVKSEDYSMSFGTDCGCPDSENNRLRSVIQEVFIVDDGCWVSGELLEKSRYVLSEEYSQYDAVQKFNLRTDELLGVKGCDGQEVQSGIKLPFECSKFGTLCQPQSPIGAGMVSSEGLCHTWYDSLHTHKGILF